MAGISTKVFVSFEDTGEAGRSLGAFREEVSTFHEALQSIRKLSRPFLDSSGPLPFDDAILKALHSIIEECRCLQHYAEEGIQRMPQQAQAQIVGITGNTYHVDVNLELESVLTLKQKLAEQCGLKPASLKLCPSGAEEAFSKAQESHRAAIATLKRAQTQVHEASQRMKTCRKRQMVNDDPLWKYSFTEPITMIATYEIIEEEMLRLPFSDPEDLAFEAVSEQSGSFLNPGQVVPVDTPEHSGIEFTGHSVLRLAVPIVLRREWTISVWTLAPIPTQSYRNLMDDTGDNRIAVAMVGQKIGDYNLDAWVDYDPCTLPAGWHHIVAVGANDSVCYYVDGELVGSHAGQTHGRISTIGNRGDGQCPEAWGIMSDLRIYGSAANEDQIRLLFQGV